MAEIAHSQRLLRVRLVYRGCKFRPFSHANSPRLSLVCVYAWRFWPIVSPFVFSQRQLSLSAFMHNTPGPGKLGPGPARKILFYQSGPGPGLQVSGPHPARPRNFFCTSIVDISINRVNLAPPTLLDVLVTGR